MAAPKPEKVAEVEDLEKRLKTASVVILTDYRGLTVGEIGTLRDRLREAAVEYRVAKNTLLGLAAARAGLSALTPFLSGPTAVVLGRNDPGRAARLLQEFIRQYRKLAIKGAVVEGEILNAEGVQLLAALPSRPELLARVVGAIQGPLSGLAFVLSGPPRALVGVLDALRARREADGGAAPLAPVEAGGTSNIGRDEGNG